MNSNFLKEKISDILFKVGIAFIVIAIVLFIAIFFQTIKNEISYFFISNSGKIFVNLGNERKRIVDGIVPVDDNFSIIIPKININSKIIPNVDPFNENEYRNKLKEGIAHAKGTNFPGGDDRIFLFAHSSSNFYENNQYNSIFYLLRKMTEGDLFYLVFNGDKYNYKVSKTEIVEAENVDYITQGAQDEEVVMMTCWPPGTSFKRLLVFGERIK